MCVCFELNNQHRRRRQLLVWLAREKEAGHLVNNMKRVRKKARVVSLSAITLSSCARKPVCALACVARVRTGEREKGREREREKKE